MVAMDVAWSSRRTPSSRCTLAELVDQLVKNLDQERMKALLS